MRLILAFLVVTSLGLLNGCASGAKNLARDELRSKHFIRYDDQAEFKKALNEGNTEVLRLFFDAHGGFPFTEDNLQREELFHEVIRSGDTKLIVEVLGLDKLSEDEIGDGLTEATSHIGTSCPDAMIQALIHGGARLRKASQSSWSQHNDQGNLFALQNAVRAACPKTTEMLISTLPESAEYALTVFNDRMSDALKTDYSDNQLTYEAGQDPFWSPEYASRVQATSDVLKKLNEELCHKEDGLGSCKALKEFQPLAASYLTWKKQFSAEKQAEVKQAEQHAVEMERQAKYNESAESSFDRACRAAADLKFSQRMIASERKAGEVSGVVNKRTLWEWGQRYQGSEILLKENSAEYRKRSGRNFDASKCPPPKVESD